jgi:hypothetical protein
VRAVAEGQFGPTLAEWKRWMAYEALINLAYSHLPAWVVYTYNANGLPDSALEAVWQTLALLGAAANLARLAVLGPTVEHGAWRASTA